MQYSQKGRAAMQPGLFALGRSTASWPPAFEPSCIIPLVSVMLGKRCQTMNIPDDRRYAATHEWILRDGESCIVGISDPAQDQLGDVVYVGDVPVGQHLQAGQVAGVVESVKAASDIHAPVAGRIEAFNEDLSADPSVLNASPYVTWIFRIQPDNLADIEELLDAAGYGAIAADG